MRGGLEREDVDVIPAGLFEVNAKLLRIDENIETITGWLEEDDDGEEEEDDPPGHAA